MRLIVRVSSWLKRSSILCRQRSEIVLFNVVSDGGIAVALPPLRVCEIRECVLRHLGVMVVFIDSDISRVTRMCLRVIYVSER